MPKATRTAVSAAVIGLVGYADLAHGRRGEQDTGRASIVRPVRSEDPEIVTMVNDGAARSATFRDLLARIGLTDGIVYVERGRCGRGVRACLVMSVTVAGPQRMLRIRLDADKKKDEAIESLGHELRHALEVLSERSITTGASMFLYYKRFGTWLGEASFETAAAVKAGDAIRRELASTKRGVGEIDAQR